MEVMSFIVYYAMFAISIYYYTRNRDRQSISITDIVVIFSWVLCATGGWFSSYGYAIGEMHSFNPIIFTCYLLFMIIISGAFTYGKKIKVSHKILSIEYNWSVSNLRIWFLLLLISVYMISFFIFLQGNLPLLNLIRGFSAKETQFSRLQVTHSIESVYELPLVFRYRKLISEAPLYLLLSIALQRVLYNKKNIYLFVAVLISTISFQIFSFEKSAIINIIILLVLNYVLFYIERKGKLSKRVICIIVGAGLCSLALIIAMFWIMTEQKSFSTIISSVMQRVFLHQTGYVYSHDVILNRKYGGCLWGKEVPILFVDSLIGRKAVSLSAEAYNVINAAYSSQGYTGTTGTMPTYYFYSNFGFFLGMTIFSSLALLTAYIDKVLTIKIAQANDKQLLHAVYATLMLLFSQGFVSNLNRVYMLPLILSPQLLIVILCVAFLLVRRRKQPSNNEA